MILGYKAYNHVIHLLKKGESNESDTLLDLLKYADKGDDDIIEFDFLEFLKSQLNTKVLSWDIDNLIVCCNFFISPTEKKYNVDATRLSIFKLYKEFIEIVIPVSIYLYIKGGFKSDIKVTTQLLQFEGDQSIYNLDNIKKIYSCDYYSELSYMEKTYNIFNNFEREMLDDILDNKNLCELLSIHNYIRRFNI